MARNIKPVREFPLQQKDSGEPHLDQHGQAQIYVFKSEWEWVGFQEQLFVLLKSSKCDFQQSVSDATAAHRWNI